MDKKAACKGLQAAFKSELTHASAGFIQTPIVRLWQ